MSCSSTSIFQRTMGSTWDGYSGNNMPVTDPVRTYQGICSLCRGWVRRVRDTQWSLLLGFIITWVELLKVSQKTPLRLSVPYPDSSLKMNRILDQWELQRTLSSSSFLTLKFPKFPKKSQKNPSNNDHWVPDGIGHEGNQWKS